jgi:hypothetical protein
MFQGKTMSAFFQNMRLDYIDYSLSVHGEISRPDLMTTFGISIAQASADLAAFERIHPGVMYYDRNRKRYRPFKEGVSVRHWTTRQGRIMFLVG